MGEYHPVLDEKGRVAIPVKLRKAFGDSDGIDRLVITHGFDKSIMAYRVEDWDLFVKEKLVPLSQTDQKNRKTVRFLLGGAAECELDKQGRVIIPGYLLSYAEIIKEITIIGLYDKFEIWSRERYDSYKPDGETLDIYANDLNF